MTIQEIWQELISSPDNILRLKVTTKAEVEKLKRDLSAHKHKEYVEDSALEEIFGKTKLRYNYNKETEILFISLVPQGSASSYQVEIIR